MEVRGTRAEPSSPPAEAAELVARRGRSPGRESQRGAPAAAAPNRGRRREQGRPPPQIEGGGGSRAVPRLRYTTNRAFAPRRGRHGRRGREQGGGRGIQRDEGGGPPRPRRRLDPVAARRTCRCLARCRRGRPEERRRRPGESEGRRERVECDDVGGVGGKKMKCMICGTRN